MSYFDLIKESADIKPPEDFLEAAGLKKDELVPDIIKPWMKHHEFVGVRTIEEVVELVDKCIEKGYCSLDLETEGLDNRVKWNEDGSFETVHKIVGYCISHDKKTGYYLPVRHKPQDGEPAENLPVKEVEEQITRLCKAAIPKSTPDYIMKDPLSFKITENPQVVIAFWNAQFDQEFLFPVTGIDWWHPESFIDGMLACFVKFAADKRIGLKPKAKEFLSDPDGNPYEMIELKELFPSKKKRDIEFAALPPYQKGTLRYAGSDAICTYMLCEHPEAGGVIKNKRFAGTYRLEAQTSCVLRAMERNRVLILRDMVRAMLEEQQTKKEELLTRMQEFAKSVGWSNLDPNSPKQLSEFLFGAQGLNLTPKPEKNEASGQYKTDEATLSGLASKEGAPSILKDIVAFRGVEKFIGTYLLGLTNNPDENDELRFSFKQTGAGTGRFSAPGGKPDHGYSGIPIHGIPGVSEVRRAFHARSGYTMVKADYAAEELRIATNISGEPVWVDEFLNGSGDLHSITARAFFNKEKITKDERSAGKTANFALLYGGGPKAIVRATGCDDKTARVRKNAFDKAVKTFAKWIKIQHAKVEKQLGVTTAFGRWLAIPDARSPDNSIKAACQRHSVNYQIQGSGADIMKIALVLLHKEFYKRGWLKAGGGDDSVRMLLTVHDEVVLEIKHERVVDVVPILVTLMESPWRLPKHPVWRVPLVVEPLIGFNWASGFDAFSVGEDYEPKPHEVVVNGFAYSTRRKPRKGESLDEQEIEEVVEDDTYYTVVDAPWLQGYELGTIVKTPAFLQEQSEKASKQGEDPPPQEAEVKRPEPQESKPSQPKAEAPKAVAPPPAAPVVMRPEPKPVEKGSPESCHLQIERLDAHTVDQVLRTVLLSLDNSGPVLHITTIVGETLVSPTLHIRVDQEALINQLSEYNLISL